MQSDGVLMVHEASATISRGSKVLVDRNSYDYRLIVSRTMYDAAQSTITSGSLVGIITESTIYVHPLDLARIGVVDGTNIRVAVDEINIVLPVRAHSGVHRGTAWLPYNHTNVDIRPLLNIAADVIDVRIEQIK
jgi:formylmethanofuran dehydrogenase subunit D